MAASEGLVDLSLFAFAPTDDRFSSYIPDISHASTSFDEAGPTEIREFYGPQQHQESNWTAEPGSIIRQEAIVRPRATMKPLPPLPRTRVCQDIARRCNADDNSQCILKRIKRTGTCDSSVVSPGSLLQRRNMATVPQLTLSAPQQTFEGDRIAAGQSSSMVWMPDEQMWLITGEAERSRPHNDAPFTTAQVERTMMPYAYPRTPAYSPRASARSEPNTRPNSHWDLTPPQTPIQSQLQSLLQPRDEERFSPLFQEAMNSVPLADNGELPPPPSYEGSMRMQPPVITPQQWPRSSEGDHWLSSTSIHRAQTTTGNRPRGKSDTTQRSSSQRSATLHGHSRPSTGASGSANSPMDELYEDVQGPTRAWRGLARRLARPQSAT